MINIQDIIPFMKKGWVAMDAKLGTSSIVKGVVKSLEKAEEELDD